MSGTDNNYFRDDDNEPETTEHMEAAAAEFNLAFDAMHLCLVSIVSSFFAVYLGSAPRWVRLALVILCFVTAFACGMASRR